MCLLTFDLNNFVQRSPQVLANKTAHARKSLIDFFSVAHQGGIKQEKSINLL